VQKVTIKIATRLLLAVIFLSLITLWVYHPSTENELVWDSIAYLVEHYFWISSLSTDNIIWMFLSLRVVNWHPLTWISWAADYQIYGGLITWGFHFTNNVLHAINSVLIFVLMLVVFGLNRPRASGFSIRTDNRALIAAFLAALLFAVHPQHVESVAWVAERKDLLCQLFLLLALLSYVKYVYCEEGVKTRWFHITLGTFFLALLSKPMAVTFPAVLLLLDVYPLRRVDLVKPVLQTVRQHSPYKLLREKLPFFLLTIASILITLHAQQEALVEVPLVLRLLNAFNSIVFYLTQLFWPASFFPQYSYFLVEGEAITWLAFLPLLGVSGITLACLFAWNRGHHAWLVAWLIYLVTLSPVLGLIQVGIQGAADRYAYLPTLPVYLLIGAGVLTFLEHASVLRKTFLLSLILLAALLLSDKTRQQIHVWETPLSLWSHAVKLNPESVQSRHNLAITFLNHQEYEKAIFYFSQNVGSRLQSATSLAWRGLGYLYLNRYDEALQDYAELEGLLDSVSGLRLDRDCHYYNIGWVHAQLGLYEKSAEYFGKVDESTDLWPHVETWLTRLENGNQTADKAMNTEKLPSFCTKVLSSMLYSSG